MALVTSATTTVASSDIEFYNNFVQGVADAGPIGEWGLQWRAIGSTETVNARQNTKTDAGDPSVPILLLDGSELVPSYDHLWDPIGIGEIPRQFNVNEFGVKFTDINPDDEPLFVWTGTKRNGDTLLLLDPPRGPLELGNETAIGDGELHSIVWIEGSVFPNSFEFPMYAVSEVLFAVPEPISIDLGLLAVTAFFL